MKNQIPVDPEMLQKFARFVQLTDSTHQQVQAELQTFRQAKQAAESRLPNTVQALINSALVKPGREKKAAEILHSHRACLEMLENAAEVIVNLRAENEKQASLSMGSAEVDPTASPVRVVGHGQQGHEASLAYQGFAAGVRAAVGSY